MTGDELRHILDDESPVKVWCEKRGLARRALAEMNGGSASSLAAIEQAGLDARFATLSVKDLASCR
jgi:hypothetical protein